VPGTFDVIALANWNDQVQVNTRLADYRLGE
jgi:hypothetical protein